MQSLYDDWPYLILRLVFLLITRFRFSFDIRQESVHCGICQVQDGIETSHLGKLVKATGAIGFGQLYLLIRKCLDSIDLQISTMTVNWGFIKLKVYVTHHVLN